MKPKTEIVEEKDDRLIKDTWYGMLFKTLLVWILIIVCGTIYSIMYLAYWIFDCFRIKKIEEERK